MIGSPLARIYAGALFELARDKGNLQEVVEEFDALMTAWNAEPRVRAYLGSPNMLLEDKFSLIRKMLGESASPVFRNFLFVVVNKQRIDHLPDMHAAFRYQYDQSRGIVRGRAKVATPEAQGLLRDAEALLSKRIGKQVTLEGVTDPAILGGVVIQIEDRIFDASVRARLHELRDRLLAQRI